MRVILTAGGTDRHIYPWHCHILQIISKNIVCELAENESEALPTHAPTERGKKTSTKGIMHREGSDRKGILLIRLQNWHSILIFPDTW